MKLVLAISAGLIGLGMAFPVGAQEGDILDDEFEFLKEEEIVYTASKHEQDITESPSAITVITREQIENTHCTDVICLLRQVPEVDVRRVLPMYAAVGARAITGELGDRVLVQVDGREVNHDVFGMAYWQIFPVHMEEIERIEVIRGPGSALYGANAHSGVISITTRKAGENLTEVYLGGGEHDRTSLFVRANQRFGIWSVQASASVDTQGHWRFQDKREREIIRARVRLDREGESSSTSVQLGMAIPRGFIYTTLAPADSPDTILGSLVASHRVDFIRARVWLGLWDVTLRPDMPLYFGEIKLGEFASDLHFFNSALDGEVQVELEPFEGNLLIAGGNYRWITMISDQLTPGVFHQHRLGGFIHDEQRLGENLVLTGGVRFDYNNITPFAFSPRLAGTWRFADNQWLRLAFGRAFRKPAFFNTTLHFNNVKGEPGFDELGEFFLKNIGNEKLENECITAFEAGYRGRFLDKRLTVEAGAFFNLYRDTVTFRVMMATNDLNMPDIAKSTMKYDNTGREVNTVGGSVVVAFQPSPEWRLSANYTYRYSWFLSEPGEGAELEGAEGERVRWERAHLANLSFSYVPESGLRLGVAAFGSSACDQAMPANGLLFDDNVLLHLPARLLISGFLAWRQPVGFGWFELGLKIYNVLHAGTHDTPMVIRPDGMEHGGELLGRRLFLYLRGSI